MTDFLTDAPTTQPGVAVVCATARPLSGDECRCVVPTYLINTVHWAKWYRYDACSGGLVKSSTGVPVGRTPKCCSGHMYYCYVYRVIAGKKRAVNAARVIWILHHGPIPMHMQIDHINQCGTDNRIENLRLATHAENARNRSSSKPLKGVVQSGSFRFAAQIVYNGRKILGPSRKSMQVAAHDYDRLSQIFHGDFACANHTK